MCVRYSFPYVELKVARLSTPFEHNQPYSIFEIGLDGQVTETVKKSMGHRSNTRVITTPILYTTKWENFNFPHLSKTPDDTLFSLEITSQ